MSPILVTLTLRSDSDFKRSNAASKKINLIALVQTLMISTTAFERMKEKLYGFRQNVLYVMNRPGSYKKGKAAQKYICTGQTVHYDEREISNFRFSDTRCNSKSLPIDESDITPKTT